MTCPRNILNKQEGPDRGGYVDGTAPSCSGTNCGGVGAGGRFLPPPAVFLMLLWLAHRTATEQLLPRRQIPLMDTPNAVRRCSCWKRNSRAEHVASAWAWSRLTTRRIVRTVREMNVTPQITRNDRNRSSNLHHRTTRQPGKRAFAIGERVRSYFEGLATK
jgi:hypothetical protein